MLSTKVKRAICLCVGISLLATGCALIPVFKYVIHQNIANDVPLTEGSMTYGYWLVPPVPVYYQLWVFHLVNPLEVIEHGAKPFVVQKGPYTYREHRKKINITFEPNNTLTYREFRWFTFDRSKSCGPDTEKFTTVNVPMMTVANLIRFEYPWVQELVDLVLEAEKDSTLFGRYSVRDIAWGYEDPLLKAAKDILKRYNQTIVDTIGLFYGTNNTDDGLYNIYTGKDDVSKLAIINTWNGMKKLPYWTTDTSRMINGTDGTFFPPFVKKSWTMYVYSTDICRSIYLDYKETKMLRGVDVYRFVTTDRLFSHIPDNYGFCTPTQTNCLPAGLLNVSNCKPEFAPIVGSLPHFYTADPSIQQAVRGLNPNPDEHQTSIDVEPNTGIAMNVDKRLQVNVFIQNISHIKATRNIKSLVFPVLWLNESAILDGEVASTFKSNVSIPMKITQAVQYGLILLGTLIALCVVTFMIKGCSNRELPYKKTDDDTNDDTSEWRTEEGNVININKTRDPTQDS